MRYFGAAILAFFCAPAGAWVSCAADGISPPVALQRDAPPYPAAARELGTEGWVEIGATVLRDGQIGWARVLRADPPGYFEDAALAGLRRWHFEPARKDGVAIECRMQTRLRFTLSESVDLLEPLYPPALLAQGIEGYVEVEFERAPDDSVINANVLMAMPRGEFEAAALAAVRGRRIADTGVARPIRRRFDFVLPGSSGEGLPSTVLASAAIPVAACLQRIVGRVRLEVDTDPAGSVLRARILSADPPGLFDEAALTIARGSRLTPARHHGQPIAATALLTLSFDPERADCPGSGTADPQRRPAPVPSPRVTFNRGQTAIFVGGENRSLTPISDEPMVGHAGRFSAAGDSG